MKKILIITILALGLPLGFSHAIELVNPLQPDTFGELVNSVIDFIFNIALVLAPLMVLFGAFYIMTAAGDVNRLNTGKKIILYTIIGFAIIILAKGLIKVLAGILGIEVEI